MSKLRINLACGLYDRTAPLYDGRVRPDGIDLNFIATNPIETLFRQLKFAEFDASEMSLSAYIMEVAGGSPRFIGLPAFPIRIFRRSSIFVRTDAGIERPEDLKGKRVGVPEYHMTAALFMRGLMSDDYDVHASDMQWFQGGQTEPGRQERVQLNLPAAISYTHVPDRTIDQMLLDGDLDAVFAQAPLDSFLAGDPRVRYLFDDPRAADLEAYQRTGIFPIMHLIVVRRDVYEANPWVALNLFRAFDASRQIVADTLRSYLGIAEVMLPFFGEDLKRTLDQFGPDFWPYGIERNRPTLDAAVRYSYEQHLSARRVSVDELFPPNLIERRV